MFKLDKIVLELLECFALVGVAVPFYPWDQKSFRPGKFATRSVLTETYTRMHGLCVCDSRAIKTLCRGMQRHMSGKRLVKLGCGRPIQKKVGKEKSLNNFSPIPLPIPGS
jgi:hypothetical protein